MLAHLGALGRHVGPLGRHLVPLARHLIATCPKMFRNRPRQPPRCLRHLFQASQKCKKPKKTGGFSIFFACPPISYATRTAPEAPRLSSKCSSWRYHAPSWRYHGPSWRHHGPSRTRLDAILDPTSIILRPSSPNFARSSHQSAPKIPRTAPRAPKILPASDFVCFFTPLDQNLYDFYPPSKSKINSRTSSITLCSHIRTIISQ